METAVTEVHARDEIAVGSMAVRAIDAVELLTGLDVGGTVALLRERGAGKERQ
jgi:hypothetical protein